MRPFEVIGARPYDDVRVSCHLVKQGFVDVLDAIHLAGALPERFVIVPVPGHDGTAATMLPLARCILAEAVKAGKKGVIRAVLVGNRRKSVYEAKKQGEPVKDTRFGFRLRYPVHDRRELEMFADIGYHVVLLDNVVDTGATAEAALKVVGKASVMAIGDTQAD